MTDLLRSVPTVRAPWCAAALVLSALTPCGLVACGGGGGGGGDARYSIEAISVQDGAEWAINRPIQIVFSEPIDFSTVNANTITIRTEEGMPALGTYALISPETVEFRPSCPSLDDFSDAGLKPSPSTVDRVEYTLSVVPASGNAPSVRALSGAGLSQGVPRTFVTPLIDAPLDQLFLDTVLGPPQPRVRGLAGVPVDAAVATRVEFASGVAPVYFINTGSGVVLPGGFEVPLNLYSDASSQLSVVVELNQAVSPRSDNISSDRLRLEYETSPGSGTWDPIPSEVTLLANCTGTGASLRVRPIGILPQGRSVRVVIEPELEDIVGSGNSTELLDFAPMTTLIPDHAPLGPTDLEADELLEQFLLGAPFASSNEDAQATFEEPVPAADWGGGALSAGFEFDGNGGPGGTFDLHIQPGPSVIFDTSSTLFTGGPGGLPTSQQVAVNGRLDVRDLYIPEGATLQVQGPNPVRIVATGNVVIEGQLLAAGANNRGVVTLLTANIPEPGAAGTAGGGTGGTGSFLTTQLTPRGGPGFGAFNTAGNGGQGGESGYNPPNSNDEAQRRPGGGGGGRLGFDNEYDTTSAPIVRCPDQNLVGLNAENGFSGSPNAISAITQVSPPLGGVAGPRPFIDLLPNGALNTENDFWGTMLTSDGRVVRGELTTPWAGAGGGAGGDAIRGGMFPNPAFNSGLSEKGSGGGGGGGSVHILALGDVVLGPRGAINVRGGNGSGGESTNGVNRIGGGSGGGSGGHLIIETASQVNLSQLNGIFPSQNVSGARDVGLVAPGGQGGAGAGNAGGAGTNGVALGPCQDAMQAQFTACVPTQAGGGTNCSTSAGVTTCAVTCAGGDGGPGIIQLHVLSLDGTTPGTGDIRPPVQVNTTLFRKNTTVTCTVSNPNIIKNAGVIKPAPIGSPRFAVTGNNTVGWDQLIPTFGPVSRAQSRWIPLGEAGLQPGSTTFDALDFFFDGTDATGLVQTTAGIVDELPPILTDATAGKLGVPAAGSLRVAVFNSTGIANDAYQRNPNLLRNYLLHLTSPGGATLTATIASATYDELTGRFEVTVEGAGPVLGGFDQSDFELVPRFFRVSTNGVPDALPASATMQIEFQATSQSLSGDPDEATGVPSAWVADIDLLDGNPDWRFVRFRVRFDIDAAMSGNLSGSTPRPDLDFLRIPFLF